MSRNRSLSGAWHRATPTGLILAAVLGLVGLLGAGYYQVQQWTPLQKYWFKTYLWATIAPAFDISESNYRPLAEVQERQTYIPREQDLLPGRTHIENGRVIPFVLTEQAYQHRYRPMLLKSAKYDNRKMEDQLSHSVYAV